MGGLCVPGPGEAIYDRGMRGSVRGAALVVALLGLLGGLSACGDAPTAAPSVARSSSGPATDAATGSSTQPGGGGPPGAPTTEGNGDMVPALPDLTRTPKVTAPPARTTKPALQTFGADVSWPQCPKGMGIPQKRTEGQPMPTSAARFVVLGLTNGPSFVANPCLQDQVRWVADRHLLAGAYSVVSYPDDATLAQLRDHGP